MERAYGVFAPQLLLPNTVDTEKINAAYNNGVLQITMAKREETKTKQIGVQMKSAVEADKGRKQVA